MPRRCCIPGCKSNYDSALKKGEAPVSTFSFPKDENERKKWIAAIPRSHWIPTKGSFVCSKHFNSQEVVQTTVIHRSDGSITEEQLPRARLVPGAVPGLFPNLPRYISNKCVSARVDPEVRRIKYIQKHVEQSELFLKSDLFDSFSEFKDGLKSRTSLYSEWQLRVEEQCVYLYTLNIDSKNNSEVIFPIKVSNSIHITADLKVKIFLENIELYEHDLKWILPCSLKISRWSQLENLLNRYKHCNYSPESSNSKFEFFIEKAHKYVERAIEHIDENNSHIEKQLDIVKDQLKLFKNNKRQYSISTKIFAFLIYFQSASCYELMRRFLFLPHKRYLQRLSSSLNVGPEKEMNNFNYIKNLFTTLSKREKIVNIVIDEIYINSKAEYKSKRIDGFSQSNPQELAKTIQSFMISSPFGHFKEIVRLIPCSSMTGQQLKDMTVEVINFVQSIGFKVLCIVTDNNRINQVMFRLLFNNRYCCENPDRSGDLLFGIYDTVHIFKNIRNNWINMKCPGKTFFYPLFNTDGIQMAAFEDLQKVYSEERSNFLKKAHKLNSKTLYPTRFERQNVTLVDNLFHNTTIAALKCNDDYKSTAQFLEIIRKWWNIVNVQDCMKSILKRDDQCAVVKTASDSNVLFLKDFLLWLNKWKLVPGGCFLSTDTFNALVHSTSALINLIEVSFVKFELSYILLGKFQSDCLEKRFGQYRQLSGCNFHVSYTQILESEKKIRVKKIIKMDNLKDIKLQISNEPGPELCDTAEFNFILSTNYLEICDIDEKSQIYVCGYAVHSVLKNNKCSHCALLIRENKGESVNSNDYFNYLQRGGLSLPALSVKILCFHVYALFEYIINDPQLKGNLLKKIDVRKIICDLTFLSLQSDSYYIDLDGSCELGHSTKHIYYLVCKVIVNIILNNYTKYVNDSVNEAKTNKRKLDVYKKSC